MHVVGYLRLSRRFLSIPVVVSCGGVSSGIISLFSSSPNLDTSQAAAKINYQTFYLLHTSIGFRRCLGSQEEPTNIDHFRNSRTSLHSATRSLHFNRKQRCQRQRSWLET